MLDKNKFYIWPDPLDDNGKNKRIFGIFYSQDELPYPLTDLRISCKGISRYKDSWLNYWEAIAALNIIQNGDKITCICEENFLKRGNSFYKLLLISAQTALNLTSTFPQYGRDNPDIDLNEEHQISALLSEDASPEMLKKLSWFINQAIQIQEEKNQEKYNA